VSSVAVKLGCAFQRATVFISRVGFMPPLDFRLAILPTEKHDTAVSKMRKIAEAEIDIFDKDAHFLDGLEVCADLV
jgi:hypothetical protein